MLTVLFISGKLQINNSVIHFKFCKEDRSSDTLTVGICYKIACFHRNAVDVSSAVLSCDHGICGRQAGFCKMDMNIIYRQFQTEHFACICFECSIRIAILGIVAECRKQCLKFTSSQLPVFDLIIISIIWLIPFVFIVLQSFRVELRGPVGYVTPKVWGLDNYKNLLKTDFVTWYGNTFIIAIVVAVVNPMMVLCMSYTLSRFRFKGRKGLMRFMLILGMFPGMLTMIILYRVLKDLGMTQANSVPGLILVYVASSGMGYYVSKGFFDTIPKSLDEAARVDGATRFQILKKIILPLSKPIVIYTVKSLPGKSAAIRRRFTFSPR